jgi:Asp/Glu/hydantoin racemase
MARIVQFLDISTYTAPPESPASINDAADLRRSQTVVTSDPATTLLLDSDAYDGVLVACYSEHDLVKQLTARYKDRLCVMGIFEASVLTALSLVSPFGDSQHGLGTHWGIVTTGAFWEGHLSEALAKYLGVSKPAESNTPPSEGDNRPGLLQKSHKFAGVFSTGLNADDFHSGRLSEETIQKRLHEATLRLLFSERVDVVVLGCAGMAGLEDIVRGAAKDAYGDGYADRLCVIDPVRAGIVTLEAMIRTKKMFSRV